MAEPEDVACRTALAQPSAAVTAFQQALTPLGRRLLTINTEVAIWINGLCQTIPPDVLARQVCAEIHHYAPASAVKLMRWRLHRYYDDQTAADAAVP